MALRSSLSKMGKLSKIKNRFPPYFLPILILLLLPISSIGISPEPHKKSSLEEEVLIALSKGIQCKKIEVQIGSQKEKPNVLKTLTVKLDSINLGQMVADYMSVIYEDPVIDLVKLRQSEEVNISSHSKNRVSILISTGGVEKYFGTKANQVKKKYNTISIKFSPPYIECLFDVPAGEISPDTLKLLDKFINGGKLEGYAAFQLKVKNNELYARSSRVIVNHFLVPELILRELETKFNPFDGIPVVKPFQYSINNLTVQNKYLFLTN